MKLITSFIDTDLRFLTEETGGTKKVYIEGVFMEAEVKNRNKRVYPKAVLETAIARYIEDKVSKGRSVGELNHPEGPAINLDKVSHRITELTWEGNAVMGKALILETPMGQIVKGLIEGGVKLGVSSRGMGSVVQKEDYSVVKEDFILATVDIVEDPSAPNAFVNGIMEGVEYFYEGNQIVAVAAEKARNNIRKYSKTQLLEAKAKLFQSFLAEISAR
jgi:hypothetical protein